MATRVGYAGTENPNDVLTAANFSKLPNGLVAYSTITTWGGGNISATADVMTLTFTFAASRGYVLECLFSLFTQNTSTGAVSCTITDNTPTQISGTQQTLTATSVGTAFAVSSIVAPGAGSATYRMRMSTSAGTVTPNPSTTSPFVFNIYDIGPSF